MPPTGVTVDDAPVTTNVFVSWRVVQEKIALQTFIAAQTDDLEEATALEKWVFDVEYIDYDDEVTPTSDWEGGWEVTIGVWPANDAEFDEDAIHEWAKDVSGKAARELPADDDEEDESDE